MKWRYTRKMFRLFHLYTLLTLATVSTSVEVYHPFGHGLYSINMEGTGFLVFRYMYGVVTERLHFHFLSSD